jgi:hypothetical protein
MRSPRKRSKGLALNERRRLSSDYRFGRDSVEGGFKKLLTPKHYQSWESASGDASKASELYNVLAAVIVERRAAHQSKPAGSEADVISLYDCNETVDAS